MKFLHYFLFLIILSCQNNRGEKIEYDVASDKQEIAEFKSPFLIGTYTKNGSEGIYSLKDLNDSVRLEAKIQNPSFLTISNNRQFVYSVVENDEGKVAAFKFENDSLKLINIVSSLGKNPCHLNIDNSGNYIAIANYSSGDFCLYKIEENGAIGELIEKVKHQGSSVNKERQTSAHAHGVYFSPDNKQLLVVDLGIDKIMVYDFDESTGKLNLSQQAATKPGSGPRHLCFSKDGKFVYVIEELSSKISLYSYSNGNLTFIEDYSTLPENIETENACAEIVLSPDGKFLYGSNRFHDSIVVYEVLNTGKLKLVSHHNCGGKTPRSFAISPDGNFMVVANQDSNDLVYFNVDKKNGKIKPMKVKKACYMPVSILFY